MHDGAPHHKQRNWQGGRKGGERKKNSGRKKECWWNDIGLPVCVCVCVCVCVRVRVRVCVFEVLCRLWLGIQMNRTAGNNELQMRETFG